MIGSGLKKLARENGMQVDKGVGYGSLRGYAATLSEGRDIKQLVITTKFTDPIQLQQLQAALNSRNVSREFRVKKLEFTTDGICIVFTDTIGTMKKIEAFIDWFFPLLDTASATKADVCSECGMPITDGGWKLIGGVAYHMHNACAQKASRELDTAFAEQQAADSGSYFKGALGAFGGSVLGAILWAIVLNMGYVASLVGFVIGWLAQKGYDLLKGKQGKGKVVILILAIIFGVVLGTFAADVITVASMISSGEAYGLAYTDIPAFILAILAEDAEYRGAVLANIGMGLLFAALGVFALLRQAGKSVSKTKVENLK